MTCPYCGKEMEKGVITSPHEISWSAKKYFLGRAQFHPEAVVLSRLSHLKGSAAVAWICKDCQKVVIDYADGACDLNKDGFFSSP